MIKTGFLSLSAIALLATTSCTPEPQACLTASKTKAITGESIAFSSCALDAKRIVWNYGDGTVEEEGENVTHVFSAPGVYQVEVKALSKKDKKWDRATRIVNIDPPKTRYLTRVQINSFNINSPSGATWDAAPGTWPDVFVEYFINGSANQNSINPPINELQINQCPVFWDFSNQAGKPILSNHDWIINLLDNDGTLLQPASELMANFSVNPATATPSDPGIITLTNSNFQIELHFIEL